MRFHLLCRAEGPRSAFKNRNEVSLMVSSRVSNPYRHVSAIMTAVSKFSMHCRGVLFFEKSQNSRNTVLDHSKTKGNSIEKLVASVRSHLLCRREGPRSAFKNCREVSLVVFSCVSNPYCYVCAIMTDVSKILMHCRGV